MKYGIRPEMYVFLVMGSVFALVIIMSSFFMNNPVLDDSIKQDIIFMMITIWAFTMVTCLVGGMIFNQYHYNDIKQIFKRYYK